MTFKKRLVLLCAVWLLAILGTAAITLIDLTKQVKGLLPIANGGTNASTAATAIANLCPTCAFGPGASTINHLATWNSTDGLTLKDGGVIPVDLTSQGSFPLQNCVPDASGLVFYTVAALTQWRQGHWEYAYSGFTGTPTLTCTVNFPHVLPVGTAKIVLANLASPDGTTAHTMTFKTCDILIGASTQVGSLTCQSTQNFTTTASAYSTSTLTFGINSTPTADSQMIVQITATAVSSLAGNVLLGQAYLEFQ